MPERRSPVAGSSTSNPEACIAPSGGGAKVKPLERVETAEQAGQGKGPRVVLVDIHGSRAIFAGAERRARSAQSSAVSRMKKKPTMLNENIPRSRKNANDRCITGRRRIAARRVFTLVKGFKIRIEAAASRIRVKYVATRDMMGLMKSRTFHPIQVTMRSW